MSNGNKNKYNAETLQQEMFEAFVSVKEGILDRLVAGTMAKLGREITHSVRVQNERRKIDLEIKKIPKRVKKAA